MGWSSTVQFYNYSVDYAFYQALYTSQGFNPINAVSPNFSKGSTEMVVWNEWSEDSEENAKYFDRSKNLSKWKNSRNIV